VNGERIVTDITANDGFWHSICVMWHSSNGEWSIYIDAKLGDNGTGLANGTFIPGKKKKLFIIAYRESSFCIFILSHIFSESSDYSGKIYSNYPPIMYRINITHKGIVNWCGSSNKQRC